MKSSKYITLSFLAVMSCSLSAAQEKHDLVPPELIIGKAGEIGVSEEKRSEIEKRIKSIHETIKPLAEKMASKQKEIHAVLSETPIDAEKAKQLVAELMDAEKEVKLLHLSAMIEAQNSLSPEQVKKARDMMAQMPPPDPKLVHVMKEKIHPLMMKIKMTVDANAKEGVQPPEWLHEKMDYVHELLKKGESEEAVDLLNKILKELAD